MAIAQQLTATGRGVNGSAFLTGGMNSSDDAMFIDDRQYFSSMNTVNRGGLVQSRPGYRCLFTLPTGRLQGCTYFRPLDSSAFLVFAVEGVVYASKYPFTSYYALPGIQFYKGARQIYWATAIKSVEQADDGTLAVIDPVRVLVMQDGGYTRAAFWDGTTSRHLDPSPNTTTPCICATVGTLNLLSVPTSIDQQPLINGDRVLVKDQTNPNENGIYTYQLGAPTIYTVNPNWLGVLTRADDSDSTLELQAGLSYFISDGAQNQNTSWKLTTAPTALNTTPIRFTRSYDKSDFLETPLGSMMAWSGDRLWVARGNRLFAGDINDPLKFTEDIYLSEGGSFFTADPITGIAEIPGLKTPQLMVFTNNTAYVIASGVRDRSTWKTTNQFQAVLFPGVGCVSHRSIITQFGLLWWMTSTGITNYNAAQQAQITSSLVPEDAEMAISKGSLSPVLERICSSAFENYGIFSMPSGAKYNRHTWVMDKTTVSQQDDTPDATWNGVWTGTFPVEWTTGIVNNVQRIFHVSADPDGNNRLWEAFTADRKDNGLPITSYIETKTYIDFNPKATGLDLKQFLFAELCFSEMYGDVSAAVWWAGTRGRYKKIAEFNFTATEGQLKAGVDIKLTDTLYGYRPQTRTVRTPQLNVDALNKSDGASSNIESPLSDAIDVGFSLLVVWSGRAALRHYRIFVDPNQENAVGACKKDEAGSTHIVIDDMVNEGFKG